MSGNTVPVSKLVRILTADPTLIRDKNWFKDSLGVPDSELDQWFKEYNRGHIGMHELFKKILQSWKSQKGGEATWGSLCQILTNMGKISTVEALEAEFGSESEIEWEPNSKILQNEVKISWPFFHGVFPPAKNFKGHTEELNKLLTYYHNGKETSVLVSGIGGIGKTELCKKFAEHFKDNQKWMNFYLPLHIPKEGKSLIWLNGESSRTLLASIKNVAKELQTNSSERTITTLTDSIIRKVFDNCSRLIVIIDKVDSEYEEVIDLVKTLKNDKGVFVVVTSRDKTVLCRHSDKTIELYELNDNPARKLIQESFKNKMSKSESEQLHNLLFNHPLALQQAVAYIKEQREHSNRAYSVTEYIQDFEKKKDELFAQPLNDYPDTLSVVYDVTFDKLSDNAKEVLKVLAYLEPTRVQLYFLKAICQNNVTNFEEALTQLQNYGLDLDIKSLEVVFHHGTLLQELSRKKVQNEKEFLAGLFKRMVQIWLDNLVINTAKSQSQHLLAVYNRGNCFQEIDSQLLARILKKLQKFDQIDIAFEFSVPFFRRINVSNRAAGQYNHNRSDQKVLIRRLIVWLDVQPELAHEEIILRNIDQEVVKVGIQVWRHSLKFKHDNIEMLRLKNELAWKLVDIEGYDEALSFCEQVVNYTLYVNECLEAYNIMQHIGCSLFHKNNFHKAMLLFERVVTYRKDHLPEGDVRILKTREWLARAVEKVYGFQLGLTTDNYNNNEEMMCINETLFNNARNSVTI